MGLRIQGLGLLRVQDNLQSRILHPEKTSHFRFYNRRDGTWIEDFEGNQSLCLMSQSKTGPLKDTALLAGGSLGFHVNLREDTLLLPETIASPVQASIDSGTVSKW